MIIETSHNLLDLSAGQIITALWVPPGQPVEIAGFLISGGMLYIGKKVQSITSRNAAEDPCVIDPNLWVNRGYLDHKGLRVGDRLSYSSISASSRSAYLEWLANGRIDPSVYIGYVFLFFYGLEYRVFRTLAKDKPCDSLELMQIKEEVKRLLSIYGHQHSSFDGHASRFLDVCRLLQELVKAYEPHPFLRPSGWIIPLGLKITLGRLAAQSRPVSPDLLLDWCLYIEPGRLEFPIVRCGEKFRQLLRSRYKDRYGEGVILKPSQQKLKVEYRPASFGFMNAVIEIEIVNLTDVTTAANPPEEFHALIDECTDALRPYSRWVARQENRYVLCIPEGILPLELVIEPKEDIVGLRRWLDDLFSNAHYVVILGDTILTRFYSSSLPKLTRQTSIDLSRTLEKVGYGIGPDARFTDICLERGKQIILFKLFLERSPLPSREYIASILLSGLLVSADSKKIVIDDFLRQYLKDSIEVAISLLSKDESIRFALQQSSFSKELKLVPIRMGLYEKVCAVSFLLSIASTSKNVRNIEESLLTQIYPLFEFENDKTYRDIHSSIVRPQIHSAIGPVTARKTPSTKNKFAIPSSESAEITTQRAKSSFRLDVAAIKNKQRESTKVSALLDNIFEDEIKSLETAGSALGEKLFDHPEGSVVGLDDVHSQFLRVIAHRLNWSRHDLETKAADFDLLLDGALEVINDAAFDICEEVLTDGEEPIKIDAEVLEHLL